MILKISITNCKSFSRELMIFGTNQVVILKPNATETFIEKNPTYLGYYNGLRAVGFNVVTEEIKEEVEEEAPTELTSPEMINTNEEIEQQSEDDPYSEYSDEDLKRVLHNLDVNTNVRKRSKLIDLINQNLPEDTSIKDYWY